ncbi:unnamed protein product [Linum trigynum]|uniref:Uncharacterized protein n=1 Tax=Linum trigynum TaxID=586398 RepID=A0AAV2F2I0_9ROSI
MAKSGNSSSSGLVLAAALLLLFLAISRPAEARTCGVDIRGGGMQGLREERVEAVTRRRSAAAPLGIS